MPIKRSIVLVMSMLAAGCGGDLPSITPAPGQDVLPGEPVQVVRLEGNLPMDSPEFKSSARLVVESQTEWELLWQRLWTNHTPIPALPSIDFDRERVLVAAMGRRPTGGYTIQIDAAAVQESQVAVRVVQTSPGGVCMLTQAMTAPIDIVKLPRTSQPVQFQTVRKVNDCNSGG